MCIFTLKASGNKISHLAGFSKFSCAIILITMKYLPTIFFVSFISVPNFASAALVKCGLTTADMCDLCDLVGLGNDILSWLIGVLMVVFAIMVVVAGFGLASSGGNPEAKRSAKSKLMNAFIGLIIVLAAWLLVDTMMKALLEGGQVFGREWNALCQ